MKSIILAIGVLFFVGPSFADTISCKNFENATYEGNKKGKGYQGPITIKFTDNLILQMMRRKNSFSKR